MKQTKLGSWIDDPCFYVSVVDGPKFGLLLGPFQKEEECRKWAYYHAEDGGSPENHNKLTEKMYDADPRSHFYSVGMVKMQNGYRNGVLNKSLGL